ncbi:M50 family metallopeptidase [Tropheryma whipplei]|uniref:M50 family metallopeptidase n=1 Tax=Tropheryma whipplei TaxID=2039 RepID=UPI0004B12013|nr:site-2 protease family protein [Tropheryma whipplei]
MFFLGVLIILVFVYIAVALHELGHMLPAKYFGVPVQKYAIGFGPSLFSFKKRETSYSFNLLPLGGYVQLEGMLPPSGNPRRWFKKLMKFAESDSPRAFWRLPAWKKIIVMFSGPFVNLILATLGYVFVLSVLGLPVIKPVIHEVIANTPAASAGILPGDEIIAINDTAISSPGQIRGLIQDKDLVTLSLLKDGGTRIVSLRPLNGSIGVKFSTVNERQSIFDALSSMVKDTVGVAKSLIALPYNLFTGLADTLHQRKDGVVGLIGAARISGDIVSAPSISLYDKLRSMIWIFASLNLALFVFNMIPLLPFDGGYIAAAVFEGARSRVLLAFRKNDYAPVNISYLLPVTLLVTAAIIVMSIMLAWIDIVNPLRLG